MKPLVLAPRPRARLAGGGITPAAAPAADAAKVLRIALRDITTLDPQQGTDLYSTRVTSHISKV